MWEWSDHEVKLESTYEGLLCEEKERLGGGDREMVMCCEIRLQPPELRAWRLYSPGGVWHWLGRLSIPPARPVTRLSGKGDGSGGE